MTKDLMSLNDLSSEEIIQILDLAEDIKKNRGNEAKILNGKSIGLIFLKSSTRTRVSFEVGVNELGGSPMYMDKTSLQVGRGESFADTANVLSRYLHGVVIRGHEHDDIADFAAACSIPVINALTDRFHPCQLLADMQLIKQYAGKLEGVKVGYFGDCASNMANSWILAAAKTGMELTLAGPEGFLPEQSIIDFAGNPSNVKVTNDAAEAAADADFVYTDVWVSMGFEDEAQDRSAVFYPYQVNDELLSGSSADVKVMHCLPAYRGKEITAEVLDGPRSIVWDEAENRLHAQKALMAYMFK